MTDKTTLPEPVVRYDASTIMWSIGGNTLVPSSTGEFVRHADHASALQEALDRAERAEGLIRWAHDTLYEINPSNYDHDEVCKINDASVEVILGLAHFLGESHGKKSDWWLTLATEAAIDRATTAEAALEGARKVIEATADSSLDDIADCIDNDGGRYQSHPEVKG